MTTFTAIFIVLAHLAWRWNSAPPITALAADRLIAIGRQRGATTGHKG
jgi:hypothetical protein